MKKIAVLGSTGSIGQQTLQVIENHPDQFIVEVLTANNSIEMLIEQAKKLKPNVVVIGNEEKYLQLKDALKEEPIKVYAGNNAIAQVVEMGTIDTVVAAMVGYAGLLPTINAVKAGKQIALANKETLVVAGDLITDLAKRHRVPILPVDSEHSAIFQCLTGEISEIEKIILTCSGGPFHGKDYTFLETVTPAHALKHPNWEMGAKITIDSATLMNKGFEVIEAKWLFDLAPEQIDVLVHPQSIIHSMVQFCDGSLKAQLGLPDMRLPIQYALTYPKRLYGNYPRMNFADYPQLTFDKPNIENFRNLALAYEALQNGGNMACALNAANEIGVSAFLNGKIRFTDLPRINEAVMNETTSVVNPDLDAYIQTDAEARQRAENWVDKLKI